MTPSPSSPAEEQLNRLFGSFKAEWLREHLFELYTEPSYLPELTTPRPCMLMGGRGTGKTTVLRCMSYEGQFALQSQNKSEIARWSYFGLYHRVNTNRVTAFQGPELTVARWTKAFAHYFNIVLCDLVAGFLEWHRALFPELPSLSRDGLKRVAESLHLVGEIDDTADLVTSLRRARVAFEAYINNVADATSPPLSLQGAPIDALLEEVLSIEHFSHKHFFFLVDEYENLEDYQQRVVNTLIKHAGEFYTFKIGVKELGWRCRTTLNENEQLISPADYARVNVAETLEPTFSTFARTICNARLERLEACEAGLDIAALLPELSAEHEAEILARRTSDGTRSAGTDLEDVVSSEQERQLLREMSLLERYFVYYWAQSKETTIDQTWKELASDPAKWKTRYENYKHAVLYTIRRGKRGVRKHYAGWKVFVQLAANNIRFLLELVNRSLLLATREGSITNPVPCEIQTDAAQQIGRKNLAELEGLTVHGARLTKLLLGLGRVFQAMAAAPHGHTPEVVQFHVTYGDEKTEQEAASELEKLLKSAVMHLALLRFTASKLVDEADTLGYDYMIHPIFSAFFVISYRRKRKMTLRPSQILRLLNQPKEGIRDILRGRQQAAGEAEPLPEQMALFEAFYSADS